MREACLAALVAAALASPGTAVAAEPCGTVALAADLTVGPPNPIASLHPVLTTNSVAEQNGIMMMYRPLLWFDQKHRIDWTESLASGIKVNADDTSFTITLRPWHWSDGTMVTASDVLYTWTLIKEEGQGYYAYGVGGIPQRVRSVTSPDPRTVVVTLTQKTNPDWFERVGLTDLVPIPRHAWSRWSLAEQQSRQSTASFYSVVDGPFRLQTLDLGRHAIFVPNDRFDGHHPQYARLIMDFLQGADPLEALETGQLDAVSLPYDLWNATFRLPGIQRVALGPQGQTASMVLNLRNPSAPFLDEVAVRDAIARATDQKRMIDIVLHGQSLPQEGFVATADSAEIPPELRGGGGPMSYDPAAARALLDAAGWHPGRDGIRVKAGRRLAFTILIPSEAPDEILSTQLMQADLARVGIAVDIKEVEFNQLIARMLGAHDGWDAVQLAWGGGAYPDGTQWFEPGSSGNYGGYADPTMDKLLAAATTDAGDGPLFALEREVVAQQPQIFLPDGNAFVLARDGLGGLDRLAAGPSGEITPEYLTLGGKLSCDAPHA